jgi:hypothetical protein
VRVHGSEADADEGGGGGAGPVAIAEQVEAGLARGSGPGGQDLAVTVAQAERDEGGAEAGAPEDGVGGGDGAVWPERATGGEPDEHGYGGQQPGVGAVRRRCRRVRPRRRCRFGGFPVRGGGLWRRRRGHGRRCRRPGTGTGETWSG